ncbi:fungal-specific transcription factor domain-containing protein [Sporodiniella umbellata]|nr:fungal-specific transcription factor domain-containing protein [Sporodiniella umbellata]
MQVKCDGNQPCARCTKGNVECIFIKMIKRGPPKSYMEGVESRLQKVESVLRSIQRIPKESQYVSYSAPFTTDHVQRKLDRFTMNEIGQAIYVNDVYGRNDRLSAEEKRCVEPAVESELGMDPTTLAEIEPWIELYFEQVHRYLPIVYKPTWGQASPSRLLAFAMCAVAARWGSDSAGYADKLIPPGYTFYQKALGMLDDFFDVPRVSTVQALVLLVKYQENFQRVGYFHRSRAYLGIAARMCVDLGLSEWTGDSVEAEIGRRTFWATFIYDLLLSIEQGRASYFKDGPGGAGYASARPEESSAMEEAVMQFNGWIQLSKILGTTYSTVRQLTMDGEQTVREQCRLFSIHTHLENFYYEMSQEGQMSENVGMQDPSVGFLYLTYHFCVLMLHQAYGACPENSGLGFVTYPHRRLCYHAATSMTRIGEALKKRMRVDALALPIRGVQHVIYCLAAAATVHQQESILAEHAVAKDMAHRQRLQTVSLVQILSRHSPSVETLKYFHDPLPSFKNTARYPSVPRKARPVSMTFLENGRPMDPAYTPAPSLAPPRPRSGTWSDLPMSLYSEPIQSELVPQPTYNNPIPSMSNLFLMDPEESEEMTIDLHASPQF